MVLNHLKNGFESLRVAAQTMSLFPSITGRGQAHPARTTEEAEREFDKRVNELKKATSWPTKTKDKNP